MVLTPFFLGAESNYADVAPFADTNVSENEESAGLPRAGPMGDIIASNRDIVFLRDITSWSRRCLREISRPGALKHRNFRQPEKS
jgi:hypothetical protein